MATRVAGASCLTLSITLRQARRLALARAGFLKPEWTSFPSKGQGSGARALRGALAVIERFGYLQLDTVSIAGARSHAIVLLSRLDGFDPALGEALLRPGIPLFEYWGHEACWMPMSLYPAFEFRRRELRQHPWWGDIAGEHPAVVRALRRRLREAGPLRSNEIEGPGSRGWWDISVAKRIATQLWSSGEVAVRERVNFQRTYDLTERVIPEAVRSTPLNKNDGIEVLLLKALEGHGWATTGTMMATWRLRNRRAEILAALGRLTEKGLVIPCALEGPDGRLTPGWVRPDDRDLAGRLEDVRPRHDAGVLLSPFDPLLWDRVRVQRFFGFEQMIEIFKPAPQRRYGYYCLPVLAGERLMARVDLKADKKAGVLRVLSCRFEGSDPARAETPADAEAFRTALARYAEALGLEILRPGR